MPTTVDLPAFNVVPPFESPDGPNAGNLAVAGDGLSIVMTSEAQPIAVGNYGDGPGAPSSYVGTAPDIFPPTGSPDWSALVSAQYVVRAHASGSSPATGSWSGFTPPPTTFPLLYLDYIGAPDELTLDPIPTSDAEVGSALDPATIADQLGRVRVWLGGSSAGSVTIDYLALRLTYADGSEGTSLTPTSPLRQHPRDDGLGTSSARRNYPPPKSQQLGIRRAGGYV